MHCFEKNTEEPPFHIQNGIVTKIKVDSVQSTLSDYTNLFHSSALVQYWSDRNWSKKKLSENVGYSGEKLSVIKYICGFSSTLSFFPSEISYKKVHRWKIWPEMVDYWMSVTQTRIGEKLLFYERATKLRSIALNNLVVT